MFYTHISSNLKVFRLNLFFFTLQAFKNSNARIVKFTFSSSVKRLEAQNLFTLFKISNPTKATPCSPTDCVAMSPHRLCRLIHLRSGGSTFQALQWPQQWAELSWVGFSGSYSQTRIQGSRFNGACEGTNSVSPACAEVCGIAFVFACILRQGSNKRGMWDLQNAQQRWKKI